MEHQTSEVHPELRSIANRIPKISVTSGNLWLWRLLMKLRGASRTHKDVLIENIFIPRQDQKTKIRLRVYKPSSMTGPVPGLIWLHGGGYVMGRPETADVTCIRFVHELGIVVVSVDYRCAPQYPFPMALQDGYCALEWMHSRGRQLGIDNRIGVGGESAGGGLAAALAQYAYDRKEIPLASQLLIYPMLDNRTCLRTDVDNGALTWSQASNIFGWQSYLGRKHGTEPEPAYAVPARRVDLSGLPPAWIGVGTLDLFHDEDVAYAQQLKDCGVECELCIVPGAFHGFDFIAPQAQIVTDFQRSQLDTLKKHLFSTRRKFAAVDMIPGKSYRVLKAFTDFDGLVHDVGERWIFTGKNFLPYEDGLTLYTEKEGRQRTFRMQWRDEAQGDIISNFSDYVGEE